MYVFEQPLMIDTNILYLSGSCFVSTHLFCHQRKRSVQQLTQRPHKVRRIVSAQRPELSPCQDASLFYYHY